MGINILQLGVVGQRTQKRDVIDQEQTTADTTSFLLGDSSDNEYRLAQSFQLSDDLEVNAITIHQYAINGSPSGNWTIRIETDSSGEPSGTLADANASVVVTPPGNGSDIKGLFSTTFNLSGSTTYWIVVLCDNQSADNYWRLGVTTPSNYVNGNLSRSMDGGSTWTLDNTYDLYFKVNVFKA